MANLRVNKIAAVGVSTENTGSVFFDGTGDYLALANSTDFNYGSDDFSIEAWVYLVSTAGDSDNHGIASNYITSGDKRSWLFMLSGATPSFLASSDGTSGNLITVSSSVDVADDTWTHVAVSRTGTTLTIYVNGVQRAQNSSFHSSIYNNTDNPVEIGGYNNGTNTFDGYISNFRICKGHAVYTENFTVPTRELEVHPETVLLCCHDGENIFSDKSGRHIIAAYGDRTSSPTPTASDSPIGITTHNPGLTRNVDATAGPTFQGGAGFVSQNWLTLPKGTTTDRNRTGGRGLFGGGQSPDRTTTIEFVTISSMGNAQDFGDLTDSRLQLGSCGSSTRGLFAGGEAAARTNIIDYVTIASTGNAVDFGDLIEPLEKLRNGLSNNTRGIFGGGGAPSGLTNIINYVTILTLGDALDFGDLLRGKADMAAASSPVRGLFFNTALAIANTEISYITIASTGNALDFGDLTTARSKAAASSSSTRALIFGGDIPGNYTNSIEYVTIPTLGNASDFGDMNEATSERAGTSNSIRGIVIGGDASGGRLNRIDYVTIQTTGNTKDFGDISSSTDEGAACSDSHGGIS